MKPCVNKNQASHEKQTIKNWWKLLQVFSVYCDHLSISNSFLVPVIDYMFFALWKWFCKGQLFCSPLFQIHDILVRPTQQVHWRSISLTLIPKGGYINDTILEPSINAYNWKLQLNNCKIIHLSILLVSFSWYHYAILVLYLLRCFKLNIGFK